MSFMTESLQRQTKVAEERVEEMVGPTSTYDRWVRWKSQSEIQVWRGDGEGWRVGGGERWRGEGGIEEEEGKGGGFDIFVLSSRSRERPLPMN